MTNKLGVIIAFLVMGMAVFPARVFAENYLSNEQIKELVSGNTMYAQHLKRDFEFKVYFDADGITALRQEDYDVVKTTYKIKDDKHCIFWNGEDRCAKILDNGDGSYTRVAPNGRHVVLWKKSVKGKDL